MTLVHRIHPESGSETTDFDAVQEKLEDPRRPRFERAAVGVVEAGEDSEARTQRYRRRMRRMRTAWRRGAR